MNTCTHTKLDKSSWGPGPWQEEPDRVEFRHAGLPCLLHRADGSVWCGYVGVPKGHPAYGTDYADVAIDVHGGLTYSDKCAGCICHVPQPGETDEFWWFGFDCAYPGDIIPSVFFSLTVKELLYAEYRTVGYVRRQTEQLAEQLTQQEGSMSEQYRTVDTVLAERERLATFWAGFVRKLDAWTTDLDAEQMYEVAVAAGLMVLEPYDPAKHGDDDRELGDLSYFLTDAGKAALRVTGEGEAG